MDATDIKRIAAVLAGGAVVYIVWIIAHLMNALFEELVEHMYLAAKHPDPPREYRSRRLLVFENAIRTHTTLIILMMLILLVLIGHFC